MGIVVEHGPHGSIRHSTHKTNTTTTPIKQGCPTPSSFPLDEKYDHIRRADSHVTGKVSAYVVEVGLWLIKDGVYLVLLSPLAGGFPPVQRVCLVAAERPHVARRHLLLQGCGGSTVHRLRGLLVGVVGIKQC